MRTFFLLLATTALLLFTGCPANPNTCTAGTAACACIDGATCNAGLQCGADLKCFAAVTAGVQFPDAAARGCEFLVTEAPGTEVVSVDFKNGAKGTWLRQAPRVAVTVVSSGDSALADSVQVSLTGPAAALAVSKASCVDLKGQPLASSPTIR